MIVKTELVHKIKDYFDLNVYETKVWLALLGKGVASAGEVAQLSSVPRSRAYDVLESLEKKGFAIVKLGKPVKYLGVKPRMILEKLKNNVRSEAEERIVTLSGIKETSEFTQLEDLYREGINPVNRGEVSAALKGKSNISGYLRDILQEAKKEVIICTSAEELRQKTKLFQETFDRLKDSNIKIKLALFGDKVTIDKLSKILDIKIKQVDIKAKFFIVDKKEILFYLSSDPKAEESAIWLDSEFFAQAFGELFEQAFGGK